MKRILVLGAGFVSKPLVDYFIEKCGYSVVIATRTVSKAESIIDGRSAGYSISWIIDDLGKLDNLVKESDLVVSLIPPALHIPVAETCIRQGIDLVTTSYLSQEMLELHEKAQEREVLILNEIGEDPGIDHMGAKKMIDEIKEVGGKVTAITSYGAGLPSFESNRNPFGYKFSWSPRGVMLAAQTPAAYMIRGERVDVSGDKLFEYHWLVDIDGIGTFETYPNRDSTIYLKYFELEQDVSLYRGLLRYMGYCNTMRNIIKLNLLEATKKRSFEGVTYLKFMASLIGVVSADDTADEVARYLDVESNDDVMKRLRWLGLFDDSLIQVEEGTNVDVLVDLMIRKMSYAAGEKDMIIVHNEIVADFEGGAEMHISSMVVEGIPNGDSAMSRAVSLPAAIASKLILEEKITIKGVQIPTVKEIYEPVLEELAEFGFEFEHRRKQLN